MQSTPRQHIGYPLTMAVTLALIFVMLVMRYHGAYPVVFADEQIYSRLARLLPLGEASIPSYLFLGLYGMTNACGDGFLDCARYLNIVFFLGAAPFWYLSARKVCTPKVAMLVALASAMAPTKIYAAYFMPESMYFFGFAVLAWVVLTKRALHWAAYALLSGAVLGVMTLIKVHALFLIPALATYMVYASWRRDPKAPWGRIALASVALHVGAVFLVKFGVGFALAGAGGLKLLGGFYGTQANSSLAAADLMSKLIPAALFSVKGHLVMLAMVFAIPLAAMTCFVMRPAKALREDQARSDLIVFTLLVLGAALGLAVIYTASIADWGLREGERLHARYYNFCFPLLVMVGAAHARWERRVEHSTKAWVIAAIIGAAMVYGYLRLGTDYRVVLVDTPELHMFGLGERDSPALPLVLLQAALLIAWALNRSAGSLLYMVGFMPLFLLNAEYEVRGQVKWSYDANAYDRAGLFAKKYLTPEQRNEVTIIGSNGGDTLRAKYHLDGAEAEVMVVPEKSALQVYQLPVRKQWALIVGPHALPPDVTPVVKTADYALVRIMTPSKSLGSQHMSQELAGTLLAGAEGLSRAEPWGRWSDSKQLRLNFRQPLPAHLHLFLRVRGFGRNVGRDYVLTLGQETRRFQLPLTEEEVHFELRSDGTEKTITIESPDPTTPQSLGWNTDLREIGIGLTKVEIAVPVNE